MDTSETIKLIKRMETIRREARMYPVQTLGPRLERIAGLAQGTIDPLSKAPVIPATPTKVTPPPVAESEESEVEVSANTERRGPTGRNRRETRGEDR